MSQHSKSVISRIFRTFKSFLYYPTTNGSKVGVVNTNHGECHLCNFLVSHAKCQNTDIDTTEGGTSPYKSSMLKEDMSCVIVSKYEKYLCAGWYLVDNIQSNDDNDSGWWFETVEQQPGLRCLGPAQSSLLLRSACWRSCNYFVDNRRTSARWRQSSSDPTPTRSESNSDWIEAAICVESSLVKDKGKGGGFCQNQINFKRVNLQPERFTISESSLRPEDQHKGISIFVYLRAYYNLREEILWKWRNKKRGSEWMI